MTLKSDLSDLSDLSDKMGAPVFALTGYAVASHVIPRGFACRCVVWLGCRFTVGVCWAFFMTTAVCGVRGRGACMGIFGIFWEFLGGLLVRHVIPRGFAVPLCGLARAKIYR